MSPNKGKTAVCACGSSNISAFNVHTIAMEVLPRDLALFLIGFQESNMQMLCCIYLIYTWVMCTWCMIGP